MEKKYRITGTYEGVNVDTNIMAYSRKQAKMRAGFEYSFGGSKLKPFMNSSSIKVREVK